MILSITAHSTCELQST